MLPGRPITSQDIVAILWRRALLVLVPPVVGLFFALVYSSGLPEIYQSDVLIAIVPQRVPDSFVKSTVTLRTEDRLGAIQTQVTSRTLLEQMIHEFGLYGTERETLPMEDVVLRMRGDITVQIEAPRGQSGDATHAFHVRFKYPDAVLAARVTQRLGASFVDQNARDRGAWADATNKFLESQLAEARTRLETQEARLEEFRQRHGNELPTQANSNMQAIQSTQLQIQALVEATARGRDRKMMLERIYNDLGSEPTSVVAQPPSPNPSASMTTGATARQRLEAARQSLAQLELRYRAEHPDVIRVKRAIAELEPKAAAELEATAGRDAGSVQPATSPEEVIRRARLREMRAEIESLDRQMAFNQSEETRLRSAATEYQRRIEAVPSVESEWAVLTRDYDTQQEAYKKLLSKSEESKVALDLERRQIGEQFRVLDPAGVPEHPISPVRIQISAAGLGIGLMLGLGLVAFLELRDTSFRTESDITQVLSFPVLALIPNVESRAEQQFRARRRLIAATVAGIATIAAGYTFWSLRLWTFVI
jgi:polysaccharide chain length determinant protein (PEP-CTERM system associated)